MAEPATPDLWTWSLSVYGRPGVAEACLEVQDRHGADVNLVLWAAWTGAVQGHLLTLAEVEAARAAVTDWHREVVVPLRARRRRLKTGPAPAPDEGTEALRRRIKTAELEAERIEQAALSAHPPHPARRTSPQDALTANLMILLGPSAAEGLTGPLSAAAIPASL